MSRSKLDKEATLREVLAEVSVVDIGRQIKTQAAFIGCWSVFFVVILAISGVTDSAGLSLDGLGIPSWASWIFIVWLLAYIATSESSYHQLNASWYFPKLGWLGSLLLAAYLVGFGYLLGWASDMEEGVGKTSATIFALLGYPSPFFIFLSAINAGHKKLMDRRAAAAAAG